MAKKETILPLIHISPPFVVDSIEIDKRNIKNYIYGKSIPILGDDFFYCHNYTNGILSFISFKSKVFLKPNDIPAVAISLIRTGKFYYIPPNTNTVYLFNCDGGKIETTVSYERPADYDDITTCVPLVAASERKLPDTLKVRWSLQPKNDMFMAVGLISFLISAGISLLVLLASPVAKKTDAKPVSITRTVARTDSIIPDIISKMVNIDREITGKGYIEKMEFKNGSLLFVIKFKEEPALMGFMSRHSEAKIEGDTVLYTVNINNK